MSGHSKWSTIKRKKAAVDAKRGAVFTRVIKEITVAARLGGGDPDSNPRLRVAISQARGANMPQSNIERAIKKGTGDLPGMRFESAFYEGYGPGGAAILMDVLTDNKKRTVADIRHLITKHGGNLGGSGSVAWQFENRGTLTVPLEGVSEDDLFETAVDYGAEELDEEDAWGLTDDEWSNEFNIYCEWTASDNLWIHTSVGFSVPGDAEEQLYLDDETAYYAQIWFWYSF